MADSVQKRILGQCRNALLGGVPILYIKTDSHILIQKLLLDETSPLVVLLSNGGRKGTEEQRELKYMRPVYELENPQDRQLRYCLNYRNSLPEMDSGGLYRELYASPRDMANERMTGPFLWSVNMPDDPQELKRIYRGLEQYVTAHEDENHPQYPVLQRSVVILYSSQVFLSPMLRTYTEFIDVGYPDEEEIRELIHSLAKERGKGILLTTHYISEAEELCDYIYVLDQGQIIARGTKEEMKEIFKVKPWMVVQEMSLEEVLMKIIKRSRGEGDGKDSACHEGGDHQTAAV